jgi:hypothetical protein
MNKYRPLVLMVLSGIIALIFLIIGVQEKGQILTYDGQTQLVYRNATSDMTIERVAQIQKHNSELEQSLIFAHWAMVERTMLHNQELNKYAEAEVLAISGHIKAFLPMSNHSMLEENTCIVDAETAFFLFGTTAVVGNTIFYNEVEYEIAEIIQNITNIFIYAAGDEDENHFNRVTILNSTEMKRDVARKFSVHYGTWEVVDNEVYVTIMTILLLFIPAGMSFALLKLVYGYYKEAKEQWKLQVLWGGIGLLIFTVSLWYAGSFVEMASDMIPNRWSDFEFWGLWWTEYMKGIHNLIQVEKSPYEKMEFWNFIKSMLWIFLAIFSTVHAYINYKRISQRVWKVIRK